MQPDDLLKQVWQFAQSYGASQTAKAMAEIAEDPTDRDRYQTHVAYWDSEINDQWTRLTVAMNSALPPTLYATPDPQTPVTIPTDRHLDLRGRLGQRTVVIRLSPAQATATGTVLIAYAAHLTTRGNGRLFDIRPPMPQAPPAEPLQQ
jgi:hypothetical protein